MVWTKITEQQYRRDDLRYASDMRDSEWRLLAPLMPPPSRVGRPREVDLRGGERDLVYRSDRLPMAGVAKGLPATL